MRLIPPKFEWLEKHHEIYTETPEGAHYGNKGNISSLRDSPEDATESLGKPKRTSETEDSKMSPVPR